MLLFMVISPQKLLVLKEVTYYVMFKTPTLNGIGVSPA
jgi:hypothetical protein